MLRRLPDVIERHGLSFDLLSKLFLSLILEKQFVALEYFPSVLQSSWIDVKLLILEQLITLNIQESRLNNVIELNIV